jgi:hypothetical protein
MVNMRFSICLFQFVLVAILSLSSIPGRAIGKLAPIAQADSRQLRAEKVNSAGLNLYADSHALVVGVSNYDNYKSLPGVKADVDAVSFILKKAGFKVEQLLDPMSAEFNKAMWSFVEQHGKAKNNRLLVYFAGHGATLGESPHLLGYLIPKDAPLIEDTVAFRNTAISMDTFKQYAKAIVSKHALFVFDSCFSGYMFEVTQNLHRSSSRTAPPIIIEKTGSPVKEFIAAGTVKQEVPDDSIFRRRFVMALEGEADYNHDSYVTGTELCDYLTTAVTNLSDRKQTPQCGKAAGLGEGDIVFVVHRPTPSGPGSVQESRPTPLGGFQPFELETEYYPSGWMGDGEGNEGPKYLTLTHEQATINGQPTTAIRIEYHRGPRGWAGIYWQHPEKNWGDAEGLNLTGAKRISFYAKGERGGEIVEFISGGITDKTHKDQYKKSLGKKPLPTTWTPYTIDLSSLSKEQLHRVIGAFAWIGAGGFDKDNRLVIYIANLKVE